MSGVSTGARVAPGLEPPAASASFRVRVRLERFFSDERARVLLCVSARRRVRWLQRRLRARFALPRLVLLCAGHLLPPWETLAVLQQDDTVEVLPAAPDPDSGRGDSDTTTRARCGHLVSADSVPGTPPPAQTRSATVVAPHVDELNCENASTSSAAPPPPSAELDESCELQEHKRRALLQLEAMLCGAEGAPTGEATRPRRRRVRRRRRPRSPARSVLHNGCPRSLTPRVIRSLDEEEETTS